ncbi:unnamed protein product [Albugo candida]|uniref:Uncharacterized protein n=1 Tax=Albugo candida TaxID=65357 RepID=A0A024GU17_9STRA|nr:unnamed protein product [Albugo candida]|eukprot:CCI50434.1 unnamed protein product [Albugo candida]
MEYKYSHTFCAGVNSNLYRVLEGAEENKLEKVSQLFGFDALWSIATGSTNAVTNLYIQELFCVYHSVHNMEGPHRHSCKHNHRVVGVFYPQLESIAKETIRESDVEIVDHCGSRLSGILKYDTEACDVGARHGRSPHGLTGQGGIINLKNLMLTCGVYPLQ